MTEFLSTVFTRSITKNGILLKSGKELEADIIVSATGLNVQMLGGAKIDIDGKGMDYSQKFLYRGLQKWTSAGLCLHLVEI